MNLHEVLMEMAKRHQRISGGGYSDLLYFNHKTKTISNGKTLVKDGKIIPQTIKLTDGELILEDDWGKTDDDNFYYGMEKRFKNYYESIPTSHDRFVKCIFPTKPINKYLSYEEMMNASNNRELARYELEWFFMTSSVNGTIKWFDDKHWFWKSPNTKLIIYKEFI